MAKAEDGGAIEVWGDSTAERSYTHVNDIADGIFLLMQSGLHGATNIGRPQYVTVDELVATVADVAGENIHVKHVKGPVGVQSRNSVTAGFTPPRGSPRYFSKKTSS